MKEEAARSPIMFVILTTWTHYNTQTTLEETTPIAKFFSIWFTYRGNETNIRREN
jgi:hypothetical protein